MTSPSNSTAAHFVVPATMDAWLQQRYGDPSTLERSEVPVPTVDAGQVLVRVAATSINAADRYLSDPALFMRPMVGGLRAPKDPVGGLDVAGTVVAVGADVAEFVVGDRVFGNVGGGFGGYTASDAKALASAPSSMSLVEAAGVPVAGRFRRADFVMFFAESNGADMATLAEMIDAGQVRTVVDEVISFDNLPAALARFRQGHVAGKIVVEH